MVNVADLGSSADKFERRASQAGQDYAEGVESVSDSDQQSATLNSADAWEQGVQQAISNGSFSAGVNNPARSWQEAALSVGQQRFTQGASQAGDAWETGFGPIADTLESLDLQPRGARGSAENRERMNNIFDALSNAGQES